MSNRQPCFLLFKNDNSGQFPMYRTTDGKIALIMFKSRETAERYRDGKGMKDEWAIEEYSPERCVVWMREALKRHGASELAIDPDPITSLTDAKVIPILIVLIEIEGD